MTFSGILVVLIILLFPWLAMVLEKNVTFFKKIGAIVTCYAFGAILGNIGWDHGGGVLVEEVMNISIPLAIPLFIYGTDFIFWLTHSKSTVISFLLCILSVSIMTIGAGLIFQGYLPEAWQISGMLAGVYTGGTSNLTAIGQSLEVNSETLILVNSIDMLAGSVLLFVFLYYGKNFLKNFLVVEPINEEFNICSGDDHKPLKEILPGGIKGTLLSVFSLGTSFGVSHLVFGKLNVPFLIFMITTLGVLFSFNKKIRAMEGPFEFGHYLLMIFCTAIGSLADVSKLFDDTDAIMLMGFSVVFGSVILHFILAKLFKIDRDTAVITSVAGIFGPPFVPVIADRFENKTMIVPGMTTGLIGFAIGNYLGMAIAFLIKSIT